MAIASANEAIGGIGLRRYTPIRQESDTGWGSGIATVALQAFTRYAFARFDMVRLYGFVYQWNPASARVMEKAGYVFEGRLGKSVIKDEQVIYQSLYVITR